MCCRYNGKQPRLLTIISNVAGKVRWFIFEMSQLCTLSQDENPFAFPLDASSLLFLLPRRGRAIEARKQMVPEINFLD